MSTNPFYGNLQYVWKEELPKNTSCFRLEDGTLFYFTDGSPYGLSAFVKDTKIEAQLPEFKDPLVCAGVHVNALHFYSTPLRRRSYKFYSATINSELRIIEFKKIREVQNGDTVLHFAHQQPFYVIVSFGKMKLYRFDSDDGLTILTFSIEETFFEHGNKIFLLCKRSGVALRKHKFLVHTQSAVEITVTEPAKSAVLSTSSFLYIITGDELLIIDAGSVVMTLQLQTSLKRVINFNTRCSIVGLDKNACLVFSTFDNFFRITNLWSSVLPERFCDRKSSNSCNHPPLTLPPKSHTNVNFLQMLKSLQNDEPQFVSDFLRMFKQLKVLGQGSYGCVFEVEKNIDSKIKWKRAVKRIPILGSENEVDDALREVAAMESFNHPGIVRFYDAWKELPPKGWQRQIDEVMMSELGYTDNVQYNDSCAFLYIQMEMCVSTVSKWISDDKVRDIQRIKQWFRQIVSAVGYIHSQGKIHRDLKPSNILITSDGVLKICDLGIVADCLIESGKSRTFAMGTPMYMAPEQVWGGYSSKVDIFALGLILVQLCMVMTTDEAMKVFDNYRRGRANDTLDLPVEVKPLVDWLTNTNDNERPNCEEILKHPFLA